MDDFRPRDNGWPFTGRRFWSSRQWLTVHRRTGFVLTTTVDRSSVDEFRPRDQLSVRHSWVSRLLGSRTRRCSRPNGWARCSRRLPGLQDAVPSPPGQRPLDHRAGKRGAGQSRAHRRDHRSEACSAGAYGHRRCRAAGDGRAAPDTDALRGGTLSPKDLAYARAGFFPAVAEYDKAELVKLGPPTKTVLVERREVGDDRLYRYELTFGDCVYHAQLGLAPDERVSQFSLRAEP